MDYKINLDTFNSAIHNTEYRINLDRFNSTIYNTGYRIYFRQVQQHTEYRIVQIDSIVQYTIQDIEYTLDRCNSAIHHTELIQIDSIAQCTIQNIEIFRQMQYRNTLYRIQNLLQQSAERAPAPFEPNDWGQRSF